MDAGDGLRIGGNVFELLAFFGDGVVALKENVFERIAGLWMHEADANGDVIASVDYRGENQEAYCGAFRDEDYAIHSTTLRYSSSERKVVAADGTAILRASWSDASQDDGVWMEGGDNPDPYGPQISVCVLRFSLRV